MLLGYGYPTLAVYKPGVARRELDNYLYAISPTLPMTIVSLLTSVGTRGMPRKKALIA